MRTRKLVMFVVLALVVLTAISFAQTTKLKRIGLYTFVEVKGQVPTPEVMKGPSSATPPTSRRVLTWRGTPSSTNPSWSR